MAKINFSKIPVKNVAGDDVTFDIHHDFSNLLYMGRKIEESALGLKIWNCRDAEGNPTEIELSKEEIAVVKNNIAGYPYIVRKYIEDKLSE